MEDLLLNLHGRIGDTWFIVLMGIVALGLSLKVIPTTTHMMVNSAAGLAGKHLGRQYRTLVINCSTNNPEIATMVLAFFFLKLGGIGTPLGSNFANIYLMFGVALGWVLFTLRLRNPSAFRDFLTVLGNERRLVAWHFVMSVGMCVMAFFAFRVLTGQYPIGAGNDHPIEPSPLRILSAACLCCIGIGVFIWRDAILRKQRPELFEDIDEADHAASWKEFANGTFGLVLACYVINILFVVTTDLYEPKLAKIFGSAVFAVLHYFLGALVTSLPEMNVAITNYRRVASADLNTALASASASNMSNLVIAAIGCLIASSMMAAGLRIK